MKQRSRLLENYSWGHHKPNILLNNK